MSVSVSASLCAVTHCVVMKMKHPGTVSVVGLKVLLSHPCRCMPVRFSVTREMCRLNFCNETLQIKNGMSLKFTCV